MLDPLFGADRYDAGDVHRRLISTAADRMCRFSGMVQELIEMREDDRAQAMRAAVADQMTAMNDAFKGLGRVLLERPAKTAQGHFRSVGSKDDRHREEQHHADLEAEADAAATG